MNLGWHILVAYGDTDFHGCTYYGEGYSSVDQMSGPTLNWACFRFCIEDTLVNMNTEQQRISLLQNINIYLSTRLDMYGGVHQHSTN